MRRSILPAGCLFLALLAGGAAGAGEFRPPPAPAQWVTDSTGFIDGATKQSLNDRLRRFEKDTGHQIVVWIGNDSAGIPIEDWAVKTFEAWGIGKRGKDDGAALFIFSGERKLRIEVGYGLEGVIPDAIANRIIQEEAVPLLRQGDPNSAVTATVSAMLRAVGGERDGPVDQRVTHRRGQVQITLAQKIVYGILGLLLLIFFVTHPRLALLLLFQMMSGRGGRGHGGFGGGGGGFGGGGGRSGGGGASGSW